MPRRQPKLPARSRRATPAKPFAIQSPDTFGKRLLYFINVCGKTQAAFAAQVQSSPGFISDVCRDIKLPGAGFIVRISKVFGLNPNWLLLGEGAMLLYPPRTTNLTNRLVRFEFPDSGTYAGYEQQYIDMLECQPGTTLLCLGEIENMPSHYIIVTKTGKVVWGLHDDMFRLLSEEEA